MREPRLFQRGKRGIWWVDFGTIGGVRHVRSTRHRRESEARRIAAEIRDTLHEHHEKNVVRTLIPTRSSAAWLDVLSEAASAETFGRLRGSAESRSRARGAVWALSEADYWRMVRESDGRCAVTGLPFYIGPDTHHPMQPSLDRANSSAGYSIGNCRLVLLAVNYAMNEWGAELFQEIAFAYAANALRDACPGFQMPALAKKTRKTG